MPHAPWKVILLPGGVLPARPAYRDLLAGLDGELDARTKELEVYATDAPPPGYSLDLEAAGIERVADEAGFERFHLVGYSAGGASSLAFTLHHPDRLLSLALMEPAFAGWQRMTPEERAHFERFRAIRALPDAEMMPAFQGLQIAPGVAPEPPPPGPPPAWMASRPAALRAILGGFVAGDMDLDALGRFHRPVYFALGGRSHPAYYARMVRRHWQLLDRSSVATITGSADFYLAIDTARGGLPRLHGRALPGAPSLRPAPPRGARPARRLASGVLVTPRGDRGLIAHHASVRGAGSGPRQPVAWDDGLPR